jgi:phage tail-like protein
MARAANTDPLRNFKFRVTIQPPTSLAPVVGGLATLGFSVVSGLTVQNEMIAYREGGMNTHPHKMVGQSDYGPVTLTKGVFNGQDSLYKWQQFMHSWSQGGATPAAGGSTSDNNNYRCDVVVAVYDHPVSAGAYQNPSPTGFTGESAGAAKLAYKLHNCWPASFSMGDLNAGDSSILIQQIVLNHEGFSLSFDEDAVSMINSLD